MPNIVKHKKKAKPFLSPTQKMFNRLKKKIETLQKEQLALKEELDDALSIYYNAIEPLKKTLTLHITDLVKLIYPHYKNPKNLSKKDQKAFKEFLLDKVGFIISSIPITEVDAEIQVMFKHLNGVSPEEVASKELHLFKQEMQEMFNENGINIDFSKINVNITDSEKEFSHKVFEALEEAAQEHMQKEESAAKPKSKKEILKELKAQELETIQKKGIGTIYKQLAKAFHPDLEPDVAQKIEKEKLMKKLTHAYENNDLHTLLSLEIEWMNQSDQGKREQSEETLKIYNSILKEQVDALQMDIYTTPLHLKYFPLHPYVSSLGRVGIKLFLAITEAQLKEDVYDLQHLIKTIGSNDGLARVIQTIVEEYST